jgi:hypothetical protein
MKIVKERVKHLPVQIQRLKRGIAAIIEADNVRLMNRVNLKVVELAGLVMGLQNVGGMAVSQHQPPVQTTPVLNHPPEKIHVRIP